MNITIAPIIDQLLIEKTKQLLLDAKRVLIFTHKNPDGDAMGASLALSNLLRDEGKQVSIICPNSPGDSLLFLYGNNEVLNYELAPELVRELINRADTICFVDFNSMSRMGYELAAELKCFEGKTLMIDHHPNPEPFTTLLISDHKLSSTCELLLRIIIASQWLNKITPSIGECIYSGMMTDTGFLSYNSSSPSIYQLIALLLEAGIDKAKIHDNLANNYTEKRMRLISYAIAEKMVILSDYKTAYIALSTKELEQFDYKEGDLEGVVNLPLKMQHIQFAVLFTESKHLIKASFRSKNTFPANLFSSENFEGGGHYNAAGGKSTMNLEDTVKKFVAVLPQYKDLLNE